MACESLPHAVGNFKNDFRHRPGLHIAGRTGETRDPYYIVGTFEAPSNNKHLLWFEIQQASHPMVKAARAKAATRRNSRSPRPGNIWTIREGRCVYWRVFDRCGQGWPQNHEHALPRPDYPNAGLQAGGICLVDILQGQMEADAGDFSIPTDKVKYRKYSDLSRQIGKELTALDRSVRTKERKHRSSTRNSKVCPAQRGAGDWRYSGV